MAGRLDESVAASQRAIAIDPASADAYQQPWREPGRTGPGGTRRLPRTARASAIASHVPGSLGTNLGNALADKGQYAEGLAACRRAASTSIPPGPQAHFNLALILLVLGNFEPRLGGIRISRWQIRGLYLPRPFAEPRWDGRPLSGKTILLHADQGYGDSIQFIRYVSLIVQRGGRVLLGVDRPFETLVRRSSRHFPRFH